METTTRTTRAIPVVFCRLRNDYQPDFARCAGGDRNTFDRARRATIEAGRICYCWLAFAAVARNHKQNTFRHHCAKGKSERDQRFSGSRETGHATHSSGSREFGRRAMVHTCDLRIGIEEVTNRVGGTRQDACAANAESDLGTRDLNTRLGARSANDLRAW